MNWDSDDKRGASRATIELVEVRESRGEVPIRLGTAPRELTGLLYPKYAVREAAGMR
jgi:hypothetical protein